MTLVHTQPEDSAGTFFDANPVTSNQLPVTVESGTTVNTSIEVTGTSITNPGFSGVWLHMDVSVAAASAAASPTLDVRVQAQDSVTSAFYDIPGASFDQITTSTAQRVLFIHPSATADSAATFNRVPSMLPSVWRITSSGGGFTSQSSGSTFTFTISGNYLL